MLFALYNVEPVIQIQKTTTIDTVSNMNNYNIEFLVRLKKYLIVHSTITSIQQRIFRMSQLFFIKRDLTRFIGLLRHYPTDTVNNVLDELINYELIRQEHVETFVVLHYFVLQNLILLINEIFCLFNFI